jgi:hypothetical protein
MVSQARNRAVLVAFRSLARPDSQDADMAGGSSSMRVAAVARVLLLISASSPSRSPARENHAAQGGPRENGGRLGNCANSG